MLKNSAFLTSPHALRGDDTTATEHSFSTNPPSTHTKKKHMYTPDVLGRKWAFFSLFFFFLLAEKPFEKKKRIPRNEQSPIQSKRKKKESTQVHASLMNHRLT